MRTSDFDYDLPSEYIAQTPLEPRDAARLMVLERKTNSIQHARFRELGNFLEKGDVLALNQTRVIPARLYGKKIPSGGKVELLLLRKKQGDHWEALVGGNGIYPGRKIELENGVVAEIIEDKGESLRIVHFTQPVEKFLYQIGHVPLPPYIHTPLLELNRYQTIFAQEIGSVAAPTAGLHFTKRLMEELNQRGIQMVYITLHIGLDTFAPVKEEDPQKHQIHTELCQLSSGAAETINRAKSAGKKIVAVGTTSVRVLESAASLANQEGLVEPLDTATDLFILPGYKFKVVDAIITNFHLPKSTLLMLVCAFAGREVVLSTYKSAIEADYRFYSFGDAMLIL